MSNVNEFLYKFISCSKVSHCVFLWFLNLVFLVRSLVFRLVRQFSLPHFCFFSRVFRVAFYQILLDTKKTFFFAATKNSDFGMSSPLNIPLILEKLTHCAQLINELNNFNNTTLSASCNTSSSQREETRDWYIYNLNLLLNDLQQNYTKHYADTSKTSAAAANASSFESQLVSLWMDMSQAAKQIIITTQETSSPHPAPAVHCNYLQSVMKISNEYDACMACENYGPNNVKEYNVAVSM